MASLVSALYHSGVGWLNDILETEVFVDVSAGAAPRAPAHQLA
jgi:hypothetical protein